MALPQQAISLFAVKTALGTSESSVISLCKSIKINKWSATKPFSASAMSYTYQALLSALKAANFGLALSGQDSAEQALSLAAGSTELWPHQKPLGTAASPCRLGDFRGYNHNAPVPYEAEVLTNDGLSGYYYASFEFGLYQKGGAEILVSEMPALQNGRWVMLWRRIGGPVSEVDCGGASSAQFPIVGSVNSLTAGNYEACMAILRPGAGLYYPVPNTYRGFVLAVLTDIALYLKLTITVECCQKETVTGNGKWRVFSRINVKNNNPTAIRSDFRFVLHENHSGDDTIYTGSIDNLGAGATTVFFPGTSTAVADLGDGSKTWGVSEIYEAGNLPVQYSYSGWVNKNNMGIHAPIAGQAEQIQI